MKLINLTVFTCILAQLCAGENRHLSALVNGIVQEGNPKLGVAGRLLMGKGKGKGKGMMMSGKGKGSSSGKGKGSSSGKGKGSSSGKGKGTSMSYKGKGSSSGKGKGSSMSYKGMSYKGKGGSSSYKGKGGSSSYKGKGGSSYKGKGKGKGTPYLIDIVQDTDSLSLLEYSLKTAGIIDLFAEEDLGVTVLAPTDDAFKAFAQYDPTFFNALFTKPWILHLTWLLVFHVIEKEVYSSQLKDGMEITVATTETVTVYVTKDSVCFQPALAEKGGCVLVADVMAKNGVAHVIDSVLLPYFYYYGITSLAATVADDVGLNKLVKLVVCADLAETVDTTFGLTLFAPTDDAFGDIDIDYYCTKGLKEITDVLLYHVAPAVVPSTQIYKGTSYLQTLYGKPVTLFKDNKDVVHVNTATVTTADFLAYNGIIHIIDEVLLPPAPSKGKGSSSSSASKGKGGKGKGGKGKGMSYKGKGGSSSYKGKGGSSSYKGKGSSSGKGKGSSSGKGKGSSSGKGKGTSMSYKGKGSSSSGKGSKGKGSSSSGKGSKGKGSSSSGKGSKGKGSSSSKGKGSSSS